MNFKNNEFVLSAQEKISMIDDLTKDLIYLIVCAFIGGLIGSYFANQKNITSNEISERLQIINANHEKITQKEIKTFLENNE